MRINVDGYPYLLNRVKALGFVVFESQDWDLNIIGERNPAGETNEFDDWIHVLYLENGEWQWHAFLCTTDPGRHWLENGNTAILVHNRQYRGVYMLGLHRGKYEALVQRGGEVTVWRDRNKDLIHDFDVDTESGYFGINIHRANSEFKSQSVNRYSAGCQVIADPEEYSIFIELCKKQISEIGVDRFSYTLLLGE